MMIVQQQEHPIERIMDNAFGKIRTLVEADTVIGTPVVTSDGVSIIPVSKVTAGFLTGGGEYSDMSRQSYTEYPFAGGSGAGVSVSPIGFLISDGKTVKLVNVDDKNPLEQILDVVPDIIEGLLDGINKK
ncbi:MAG: sporulation protein YtfJ [Clostridia bacterium]|jgi:sporulation protein YtfJ|nr:sporulation protein YtfJ [Clostridia bacterium]